MSALARWIRVLVLPGLLVGATLAAPTSAGAADGVSPQAEMTFAEIAGCLAAASEMRVAIVVDESRSLRQTDPDSERTAGLLAALDSLAVLQQASPDKHINVSAATFAADYVPRVGWGQAAGDHLLQLRAFATEDVPNLNNGTSTDYRAAIKGASADLAAGGGRPCKVMLWFTDGGLDVGGSDSDSAAALQETCTPGGIADAARADGVHIVAGALFRPDSQLVTDQDRATLAQVAEGEAAGGSCGAVPVPDRYAGGAYVSANDPSQLSALFASLLARISGFTPSPTVECPGDGCVSGAYRFAIDPGIAWVRLIAVPTGGSKPRYSLTEPGGTSADLPPNDSVGLGGYTVETSQAGATAQFDIDVSVGNPVGQWTFNVKDGSAIVGLYLLPGLQVALDPADQQLAADGATDVGLLITNVARQPVDPEIYSSFRVSGSVDAGPPQEARQQAAVWVLRVPAPPSGALPSSRQLTVSIDIVTSPSGLTLDPVVRQFTMPVSLTAYFPTLQTQELVMSSVEGDGASRGSVTVAGSPEGDSRACITPVTLTGPQGQDPVAAQPEQACIDLAPNATGELALRTPNFAVASDGTLTGTAQVTLSSVRQQDESITFDVPTRMSIARPVDEAVRWLLVIALLAASLAVPLLMVYLLGRRLARFDTGDAEWVRVLRVPVELSFTGTQARLLREGGPLWLGADDVAASNPDPPHRRTAWSGGGLRLATRFRVLGRAGLGRWQVPTLALDPSAQAASQADGTILAADYAPHVNDEPPWAPSNLRLERNWFLEFDLDTLRDLLAEGDGELPPSGAVPATLIVLRLDSAAGTYAEQGQQLAAETEKPLRMLHGAVRQASSLAPLAAPAVAAGVGAGAATSPGWLGADSRGAGLGSTSVPGPGTAPSGPRPQDGDARAPSASGAAPPRRRRHRRRAAGPTSSQGPQGSPRAENPDDGIPDWLRG